MTEPGGRKPVYIVQHNHFDPLWRRCWDRTFDYRGKRYRSYADLEEFFIDRWIINAQQGATFSEGQAVVLRSYLERNPDRLERLRRLVRENVLELTAAGEVVPDTNMPSGETLLRNLMLGQLWFHETFGRTPNVGWLEDAFGQSAQIPQIYRGCECDRLEKLSYKRVPGRCWKGLDGTVIFTGEAARAAHAGHCIKIPPCPECEGAGCLACEERGLSPAGGIDDEQILSALALDPADEPFGLVQIGGEEAIPNLRLPDLVEKARRAAGTDLRWGGFNDVTRHFAEEIAAADGADIGVSDQVEANPVSTGCYVTRIAIKQQFRRLEGIIQAAERWATLAFLQGEDYPDRELLAAWRTLCFAAFHDAITSTHIDAACHELEDMMSDAEDEALEALDDALEAIEDSIRNDGDSAYLVIYNGESWERTDPVTVELTHLNGAPELRDTSGRPIPILDMTSHGLDVTFTFVPPPVPAFGYTAVEVLPAPHPLNSGVVTEGPGYIENEFFRISCGEQGITSIVDLASGDEIVDSTAYLANELLLEEDVGHPWGTMQAPSFEERLSAWTTSVQIRRRPGLQQITLTGEYRGKDSGVRVLSWRQVARLYAGVARIEFETRVDWDTAQRRIRVVFPTRWRHDEAVYSIPYGCLARGSYEPDMSGYPSTNGDWPAVGWVDLMSPAKDRGVALINAGTPSHKVKDGVIYMSLLRSPTDSWCLNEPEYYDCPDFDGARDAGVHEFYYCLVPHAGDHARASIEKRAREFNSPMIVRMLDASPGGTLPLRHSFADLDLSDNVIVSALKKAETDDSIIVRLAETDGQPGSARVRIPDAGQTISRVNYLERKPEPCGDHLGIGPFKVVTLNVRD